MDKLYIFISILIIGGVTFLLRALPFTIDGWLQKSGFVTYIKDRFPMIMMFILTLYAANIPAAQSMGEIMPQAIALVATGLIHWALKNFFISIFVGVAIYITIVNVNLFSI